MMQAYRVQVTKLADDDTAVLDVTVEVLSEGLPDKDGVKGLPIALQTQVRAALEAARPGGYS